MIELMQWLGLAILLLIFAGFAFLFVRHGNKVKPDPNRRHEDGLNTAIGSDSGPGHV